MENEAGFPGHPHQNKFQMDPTFYKDQRKTRVYCKNNCGLGRALKTTQSLKGKHLTIKNLRFSISKNPKPEQNDHLRRMFSTYMENMNWHITKETQRPEHTKVSTSSTSRTEIKTLTWRECGTSGRRPRPRPCPPPSRCAGGRGSQPIGRRRRSAAEKTQAPRAGASF